MYTKMSYVNVNSKSAANGEGGASWGPAPVNANYNSDVAEAAVNANYYLGEAEAAVNDNNNVDLFGLPSPCQ